MDTPLYRKAGTLADDPYSLVLTAQEAGWSYSALRVLELRGGESAVIATGDEEMLVLPLAGSCLVACDDQRFELTGRDGVFSAVTDFAYLPRDASAVVSSDHGGRFALPAAAARKRLPARYGPASQVPVELRGSGACSRQVNNFCTPGAFETDRLIACEVLTPAGNWSSYPPHKHDTEQPGECVLEEIYYFELGAGPAGPGLGYHRVYSSDDRPADLIAEVRSGDVVLVPYGWHGPAMAVPGYDMYYLNVMAGPGADRAWLICDDPAHAWIRDTWPGQPPDPRLPLTSGGQQRG
ncbi:MAG TPA: 5-deoxy-glucuronate isomerase [Streptosporangiaceae bacterium]|nr:5-deoxy-glucuronate isomerase [Streptosporangiaceae bacterium]